MSGTHPSTFMLKHKDAVTEQDWIAMARYYADDAHRNSFESRRGGFEHVFDCGGEVLVIYNNNPYAALPGLRDEELAQFRLGLAELNSKELGFATNADGYTYAMILDAPGENWQPLVSLYTQVVNRSRQMYAVA